MVASAVNLFQRLQATSSTPRHLYTLPRRCRCRAEVGRRHSQRLRSASLVVLSYTSMTFWNSRALLGNQNGVSRSPLTLSFFVGGSSICFYPLQGNMQDRRTTSGTMQRSLPRLPNGPNPTRPCSLACGIPGCRFARLHGTTKLRLLQLHQDSGFNLRACTPLRHT